MKKKGSALIISIFVLAIVSMLILSSFKTIVSRHGEIQDDIQVSHDDNIRDNGLRLLKYELKKINDYQDQRGMFFKKGSKYLLDTKAAIDLNTINYNADANGKDGPTAAPKNDMYYSGVVINSYYDYIGKTLIEPKATIESKDYRKSLPWFAINLYYKNGTSKEEPSFSGKPEKNYAHLKWISRLEDNTKEKKKYVNLESLIKENDDEKTSIGGYKVEKVEVLTGNKHGKTYYGINSFNSKTSGLYNGIAKITYEKQIVVKTVEDDQSIFPKSETYLIEMSIQGYLKDGDFIEDNLIKQRNIVRTAKITKIGN